MTCVLSTRPASVRHSAQGCWDHTLKRNCVPTDSRLVITLNPSNTRVLEAGWRRVHPVNNRSVTEGSNLYSRAGSLKRLQEGSPFRPCPPPLLDQICDSS